MRRLLPLTLLATAACLPEMDDNSVGMPSVDALEGADEEELLQVQGELLVTAGEADGDWIFALDTLSFTYRSPSQADLSALSGPATLTLARDGLGRLLSLHVDDEAGVAFSFSAFASEDGSTAFGRSLWSLGDALGRATVIDGYGEEEKVEYREVLVAADDGEAVLLPGEPTDLALDGGSYRSTVLAAFETVDPKNSKCGAPDVLALELVRGETDPTVVLDPQPVAASLSGECG